MSKLLNETLAPLEFLQNIKVSSSSVLPNNANVQTYGSDGKTIARNVKIDYGSLKASTRLTAVQGKINIQVSDASNNSLNASVVNVGSNGLPSSILSTIFDKYNSSKTHKTVTTDFSQANWSADSPIIGKYSSNF